jgi:phosphopantothenoylcysteine decarboxylase/phosphopantothenate--cysteine ligase
MPSSLHNKHILLGVTGGIAAYKSADLVRRLREAGASVRVVMTENAKRFITPLTMQAVSGLPVHEDLFDVQAEAAMGHIELARWAEMILVAPATADFIARLAQGLADDLLSTLCLATDAKIALAPAMNQMMWKNTITQSNMQALITRGIHVLDTAEGSQACGDVGPGRMLEPTVIVEKISPLFTTNILASKRVVITAGPTHEAIDPVRFISNPSSGKMGFAIAEAAAAAGAEVILISGPVNLATPKEVKRVDVVSADQMFSAVKKHSSSCDIFFGVAAVADYRSKEISKQKIHKTEATLTLSLERNSDIISDVAAQKKRPFIVGFAAETENVLASAKEKLQRKNLDIIVANKVGGELGFGSDENEATVLWKNGQRTFPRMSKQKLAQKLIELVVEKIKKG